VENEKPTRRFVSVFTNKVRAGKRRTYFFDVRQTKGEDYYITITESTKRFNSESYERHKIFLYKEDFNRFVAGLQNTVDHVKTNLMPDYDYNEYDRRNQEWDERKSFQQDNPDISGAEKDINEDINEDEDEEEESGEDNVAETARNQKSDVESEEDMEW